MHDAHLPHAGVHRYPAEVADLSLLHKGRLLIRFPQYNIVQRLKPHQVTAVCICRLFVDFGMVASII